MYHILVLYFLNQAEPAPYIDGVRINSPHYLVKIKNIPVWQFNKYCIMYEYTALTMKLHFEIHLVFAFLITLTIFHHSV